MELNTHYMQSISQLMIYLEGASGILIPEFIVCKVKNKELETLGLVRGQTSVEYGVSRKRYDFTPGEFEKVIGG
jgi:hypothetical protein